MKTLAIFYSYSGHSKKLAEEFAAKENADLPGGIGHRHARVARRYLQTHIFLKPECANTEVYSLIASWAESCGLHNALTPAAWLSCR